jgi:RimJ/RimL family protein N-acetyltransferase
MKVDLRPLRESDAYTSVRWRNDPDVWTYTLFTAEREISVEDELNWIRKVLADPTCRRFAILAEGIYVGNVYLTGISNATAEYHIFIGDKRYWRRGVARAATTQIIEFGRTIGLGTIHLLVHVDNVVAQKLYASLSWEVTGQRDDFVEMSLRLTTGAQ